MVFSHHWIDISGEKSCRWTGGGGVSDKSILKMGVEQGQNIISTSVHQNIVHKYKVKVSNQNYRICVDNKDKTKG